MKVHIPYQSRLDGIEFMINKIDTSDTSTLNIVFDEKCTSAHPVVFAMLACLGSKVLKENGQITLLQNGPLQKEIDAMRLREALTLPTKEYNKELAGKYIPLYQIKDKSNISEIIQELVPLLHCPPEQADPIKYVLSEMIRNVLEHADTEEWAFICAKYIQKTNKITLGIADYGIWIKNSLDFYHHPDSHKKAIQLALTPWITWTTAMRGGNEYNGGFGLFLVKSIAKVSNNYFVLYSWDTLYRLRKDKNWNDTKLNTDPLLDNHTMKTLSTAWQWTVIGFDISLDNQDDFKELLKKIQDAYHISDKVKEKDYYKKPKFS